VLDQSAFFIELVEDEICISLMRCREDDDLIKPGHISQKSYAKRPHLVDHAPVLEMDQGLVKVENERILAISGVVC